MVLGNLVGVPSVGSQAACCQQVGRVQDRIQVVEGSRAEQDTVVGTLRQLVVADSR